MATIINADTSDGLKLTSDTSGQIDLQSAGSTKATIDTSGNLKFNSGYGSVGTAYGVRAWVNFNGTGTVAIRDSGNVSSITDNGTGNYTANFTTNMPDINYVVSGIPANTASSGGALFVEIFGFDNQTVSGVRVQNRNSAANYDALSIQLSVIR
jgi:hypothetical protein